jgi:hypothetical protein
VSAVHRRLAYAVTALALLPLAGCGGPTISDEVAYPIDQPFTALVIDARAAAVEITTAAGPTTVRQDPASAHRIEAGAQAGAVTVEALS